MVKIYYRESCGSSRRAISWFERYSIEVEKCKLSRLDKKDFVKILSLSERGIINVIKKSKKNSLLLEAMSEMQISEAIDFLLLHTYLLQSPIILVGQKLLIGYNEEEIRKFLPKEYRRHKLR